MFDFRLSKVPWRHDERSEGEKGLINRKTRSEGCVIRSYANV